MQMQAPGLQNPTVWWLSNHIHLRYKRAITFVLCIEEIPSQKLLRIQEPGVFDIFDTFDIIW